MRIVKKGMIIGMAALCMPMLSACSFKETLGILWNHEDTKEEKETQKVDLGGSSVDESVAKPEISSVMGDPVTYELNGTADELTVEASVSDGGVLTYQWYSNNVDSNGGGTAVEGATEASFTPPTDEVGTVFYYVVVTNTVGDGIQLTASETKSVTISEEPVEGAPKGTWKESADGWWYEFEDGTYPTGKWEKIDGKWYAFDSKGYMRTGWYQDGEVWYYLNKDGSMAADTDVDGYHLGPDGVMQ